MLNPHPNSQGIQKRADKNLGITALLTLFVPFGGYIYTLRYTAAVLTFLATMFLFSAEEMEIVDDDVLSPLYGLFAVSAAVENSLSVRKARELTRKPGLTPLSTAPISFPQAQVQIIKVGKQQGEMTVTDFVVATELPPAQVKETLMELEHSDLVRSHNRESDGVVVYQVIWVPLRFRFGFQPLF